jgi:hypothetical protein
LGVEDFDQLIPGHLFHAVFEDLYEVESSTWLLSQTITSRLPLYKFPCSTRSWIPAAGGWLSHKWIDTTRVTDKAAKRDDAPIAIDMWNSRLLWLYPQCRSHHLDVLRTWLLGRVRHLILTGLRQYLTNVYGSDWCDLLRGIRRESWMCLSGDQGLQPPCHQGGSGGLVSDLVFPHRLLMEVDRGIDLIERYTDASWWEWTRGSALAFGVGESTYNLP